MYKLSRTLVLTSLLALQGRLPRSWSEKLRQNVTNTLGGVAQKIHQFAGMRKTHPRSLLEGLAKPQWIPEGRARLNALHPLLAKHLDFIDPQVLQGSIAHVYRARDIDGNWLALKVRRPGIAKAIQADTALMRHSLYAAKSFRRGFNAEAYTGFFSEELKDELDLLREARVQSLVQTGRVSDPRTIIPEVISELSNAEVLAMRWESSQPLAAAAALGESERDALLNQLACVLMDTLFEKHILLADLNPGNLGCWSEDLLRGQGPSLVVYDFGSALEMASQQVEGFKSLLLAVKNHQDPMPALNQLGFQLELLQPIEKEILPYLEISLAPFLCEAEFDFTSWQRKEKAHALLGEKRWTFMQAAPPNLFAWMRCFQGWFYWHGILNRPFKYGPALFKKLQGLDRAIIGDVKHTTETFMKSARGTSRMARTQLHIHVKVQGESRVKLSLPGHCAGMLGDLMDPEIKSQIESQGIDLIKLSHQCVKSDFAPSDIFRWENDSKSVHIFLA